MVSNISQKNLFIEVEEAQRIIKSISKAENKFRILLLLVASGVRPCEAVQINLLDFVKPDYSQFYVNNSKVVPKGKLPRRDLKIVPKWMAKQLREYVELAHYSGQVKQGYIFPSYTNNKSSHMAKGSLFTWFHRKRKELGLLDVVGGYEASEHMKAKGLTQIPRYRIGLYSFRRLFATEAEKCGIEDTVTAFLMGHQDTKTTQQYKDKRELLRKAPVQINQMPNFFETEQSKLAAYT